MSITQTVDGWLTRLAASRLGRHSLLVLLALLVLFGTLSCLVPLGGAVKVGGLSPLGLALVALALKRLGFRPSTIAIILAGLAFYLVYLSYTSFNERNYDGIGQLKYVRYVLEHHARPPATKCLICHHPPLYYAVAAVAYAFVEWTGIAEPTVGLQVLSLIIFLFFIIYGVLLVRRFSKSTLVVNLATALIVFWPYSIHNSIRVHNDTLTCTLMVTALYYLVKWDQEDRSVDLYLCAVFVALGVLTKANAYIMVASLLVVMGYRLLQRGSRWAIIKQGWPVLWIVGAAMAFNVITAEPIEHPTACQVLLGRACKSGSADIVGNQPYNYVYFDPRAFIVEPYVVSYGEGTDQHYFWNHLLKSSLFGTHNRIPDRETGTGLNVQVARVSNGLLLGLIAYLLVGLLVLRKPSIRRFMVLLLTAGVFIGFLMAFRAIAAVPHHNDFRHVFPLLVPASLFFALTVRQFRQKGHVLEYVGYGLAVPLLLASVLYWSPKWSLITHHQPKDARARVRALGRALKGDKASNEAAEKTGSTRGKLGPKRPQKTGPDR